MEGALGLAAGRRREANETNRKPRNMNRKYTNRWPNRAAAYVRMSTEHQQYSTSNQLDVIREYSKKHGMEIVKVFSDDGKSG